MSSRSCFVGRIEWLRPTLTFTGFESTCSSVIKMSPMSGTRRTNPRMVVGRHLLSVQHIMMPPLRKTAKKTRIFTLMNLMRGRQLTRRWRKVLSTT